MAYKFLGQEQQYLCWRNELIEASKTSTLRRGQNVCATGTWIKLVALIVSWHSLTAAR